MMQLVSQFAPPTSQPLADRAGELKWDGCSKRRIPLYANSGPSPPNMTVGIIPIPSQRSSWHEQVDWTGVLCKEKKFILRDLGL